MKKVITFTKKTIFKNALILGALALVTVSCSDDDENPEVVNEEEVITTMNITLTSATGNITLQSQDLDGDGPDAPVITVENLTANTTYSGIIELLNETEEIPEDVTLEVAEEDDEHQFFFVTSGAVTSTDYSDSDENGNPVGIAFELTTGDAGSATLQVTLRHLPAKPNDGTLEGAGGDTDIAQTFTLTVE